MKRWCAACNSTTRTTEIEALAAEDRVLAAAVKHRGLGRGKLYPDLFEALCGVVCAQRTSFARIYGMMRKLAEAFGEPTAETVDGASVYVFPTPAQMAAAGDEQIRACGVGFRAKGLANVSTYLAESGYAWQDWMSRDPAEVIPDLLGIKGVGPYTANLAVNLTYGRGGTAHVDTYVTNVIGTLYLDDPNASPEQVAQFIDHRWGELRRGRARPADHRHRGLGRRAGRHGRGTVRCPRMTTAAGGDRRPVLALGDPDRRRALHPAAPGGADSGRWRRSRSAWSSGRAEADAFAAQEHSRACSCCRWPTGARPPSTARCACFRPSIVHFPFEMPARLDFPSVLHAARPGPLPLPRADGPQGPRGTERPAARPAP